MLYPIQLTKPMFLAYCSKLLIETHNGALENQSIFSFSQLMYRTKHILREYNEQNDPNSITLKVTITNKSRIQIYLAIPSNKFFINDFDNSFDDNKVFRKSKMNI